MIVRASGGGEAFVDHFLFRESWADAGIGGEACEAIEFVGGAKFGDVVVGFFDPGVECGAEFVCGIGVCGVFDEVVEFVGIVLGIIEFLGGSRVDEVDGLGWGEPSFGVELDHGLKGGGTDAVCGGGEGQVGVGVADVFESFIASGA